MTIISLYYISPIFAQDTQLRYERKSISFVDAVLPLGDVRLSDRQEDFLLSQIKSEIEMSRFDYNPLPEALVQGFRRTLREERARDPDAVAEVMNQTLVPQILRILDYEKEMRAQGLVGEAERHSFVVEKAKETGVTEADLWAVMNSAYIYLPILYHAEVNEDRRGNTTSADLEGGVLWFRVLTSDSGSAVRLLARKTAAGYSWARTEGRYGKRGRDLQGSQYAFVTAAETFARNLRVATQEIPDFQLTNPLTQTGPGWVEFSLGKPEGVGLDDKFIIAEFDQMPDSSLRKRNLGMVRVTRVGTRYDGRSNSRARTVIGGEYQPGMVALEHPRLPIDLSFRLALLPVKAMRGRLDRNLGQGYQPDLLFTQDSRNHLYAGQLWFNYDLARSTNVPQFFASVYGELGGGKLSGGTAYGNPFPVGFYFGLGGGLAKKFYVNRFHFSMETLVSFAHYQVSGSTDWSGQTDKWQWKISNLGLTLNGNVEVALGYDLNLGAGVSYRAFVAHDAWAFKYNGADQDLGGVTGLPKMGFGGWGGQAYFTWSLPTLSTDPLKLLQGAMGR